MASVEARRGKIIIQIVCLEPWESIEVILGPLPHVAKDVVETECVGRVEVDWLQVQRGEKGLLHAHAIYTGSVGGRGGSRWDKERQVDTIVNAKPTTRLQVG